MFLRWREKDNRYWMEYLQECMKLVSCMGSHVYAIIWNIEKQEIILQLYYNCNILMCIKLI